jgi:hypothetical protein
MVCAFINALFVRIPPALNLILTVLDRAIGVGSSDGHDFLLPAIFANQQQGHFPRFLVHLSHQPQVIRPAMQAFDDKPPKRTASGRLAGLVILTPHEISCAIHPRRLSQALDKACPTENYPSDFRIVPAAGRLQMAGRDCQ